MRGAAEGRSRTLVAAGGDLTAEGPRLYTRALLAPALTSFIGGDGRAAIAPGHRSR